MVGLKKAFLLKEYTLHGGNTLKTFSIPSPDVFFMLFDLAMVMAFVSGWTFSLIKHREILSDNPILRAFEANNICIGVDKGGARIAANIAWGFMLLPLACYLMTSYIQMQLWENKDRVKFDVALMTIAYLMLMTFGLCFGIEPQFNAEIYASLQGEEQHKYAYDKAWTIKVHTWGFCIALLGYALTRLVEIRSFFGGHLNKGRTWKDFNKGQRTYVRGMAIHFLWCAGGCIPLFKTLLLDDLVPYVETNPPDDPSKIWLTPMSIVMWVWSLGILALPFIMLTLSNEAKEDEEFPMEAIHSEHLPIKTDASPMY